MKKIRLLQVQKWIAVLFFACASVLTETHAQSYALDNLTQATSKTPTLAYSLRKLKAAYTGPAVRVRNAANTDSVDVYFDTNGLVSLSSPVSASVSSGTVGSSTATTLTAWAGTGTAFVTRWYNQTDAGRDAVNPAAVQLVTTSTLTTSGTTVTLGTPMTTFVYYDLTTSAATTNNSLKVAATPSPTILKMAVTGAGIPDGTFAQTNATTITTTKTVNVTSGITFRAYGLSNTYQPGNLLMDAGGKPIGIIKSIESSTSLTLVAAAPENKTYLASEWGMSTQPTLVKDGVVENVPGTAMPAIRVYNGPNSNTRFVVTPYTNDGGTGLNLSGVQNMNLFFLMRPEGNVNATNGGVIFGTRHSTNTAVAKMAVSITFTSSFVSSYKLWRSTVTAATPNFPTGINNAVGRMSVTSDGTNSSATMYTSTSATAGTAVSAILGTPPSAGLDGSNIQLLGHSDSKDRMFEGLASEIIFYGTTTTTGYDEADAVSLYNNETLAYVTGATVLDPKATSVTETTATIGANVAAEGKSAVTACGTYYGTTENALDNGAVASVTTGVFTRDITGLTANTKYYYRGYATNTGGTNYTVESSFTTLPAAPVSGGATAVTSTGFTANWTAPVQGAEAFTYTLEYSLNADMTGATAVTGISGTSSAVSSLTALTNYYYRVKAVNAQGAGAWSAIQNVTTDKETALKDAPEMKVTVAPNPVTNYVQITLSKAGRIEIYDAVGKTVYAANGKAGVQIVPASAIGKGLFLVKAENRVIRLIVK